MLTARVSACDQITLCSAFVTSYCLPCCFPNAGPSEPVWTLQWHLTQGILRSRMVAWYCSTELVLLMQWHAQKTHMGVGSITLHLIFPKEQDTHAVPDLVAAQRKTVTLCRQGEGGR